MIITIARESVSAKRLRRNEESGDPAETQTGRKGTAQLWICRTLSGVP